MLAVYGKGGMGKSFFTTNLVSKLALLDKRVMQLGCDPKHDSCNALFGGVSLPTLGDVWRRFKEEGREEALQAQDVIFKTQIMGQTTVYGCEIGGPEVGRGCGGRGITFGFDLLEKLGLSQWALDFVVMDFLGDVVCGGFATPLSRSLAEEVIILCGNDRQSLYAANNIASAAKYFASMGGQTRLVGLVVNRDDGSGVAARFAQRVNLPILASLPLDRKVRELADACQLALSEPAFDALFERLAQQVISRTTPPVAMADVCPLEYQEFLSIFGAVEPDQVPAGASASELLGGRQAPRRPISLDLNLRQQAVGVQPEVDASMRRIMGRMLDELGLYVTEANRDPKKGMTLTIDGNTTICLGDEVDLESKFAILAALKQSGEAYCYVDLRRPASPFYR
ncbi:chlorophyllide a reductase iron protein subunit X [Candidatus Viridilinea mediisalina]|uniref:nitrogenase n=2 Tax=Candidatus Viridilinea mediisalina TaxID=2024553 RepID=A0A2A6RI75_9CHLR|nr:chlorophyllide a reductase iron protein subunit X [Candidatus Viridilinea mediisalina]